MILFHETRPATLEDVRWLRKKLRRRLEDSCLRAIDPALCDRRIAMSPIDSVLLAVTEIGNNAVQHAAPSPSFLSLEVRLVGDALRIEFCDDGGHFEHFEEIFDEAGRVSHSADFISGRGLSLVGQSLHELQYHAGTPNRLVGWKKLRRSKPHVLIVERNAGDARDLATMLSQSYVATCARRADDAAKILASQRVDVILTGYEPGLHREDIFKTRFDECPIPLVLMATPAQFARMRRSGIHHADQCLQKPVSAATLIAVVEIAIGSYTRRLIHLANYFGRSAGVLLVDELPREIPGFQLEIMSGTAAYGGGDFGLALRGDGFTRLVVADIMGHGLKAKAGAIALSAIVRTLHCQAPIPADRLLCDLSQIVSSEPAFTDIISTLIVVDASTDGWIEASCAGHPPVAIISPERSFVLPVTGPLPGLLPLPAYALASHRMKPGDKIAIVTDGIDSQSSATADFPPRLLKQLSKDADLSLLPLKQKVERWLARRLGPAPKDDWTLMIGEFRGVPADGRVQRDDGREFLTSSARSAPS
jgi:anti-sigma regulatory factor (Ser/Thr protein kinase)/CheY-like chemotaxis protein